MARKNYNTPRPDYYVTIGGKTKEGVKNPDSFEGHYLCSSTAPDPFNEAKLKTTFLLKDPAGKIAGVNGNANLVFQFQDAEKNLAKEGVSIVGLQTYIDYVGERKSDKKGRSPTKLFQVDFDQEDRIEVLGVSNSLDTAVSEAVDEAVDEAIDEVLGDDLGDVDNEPAEPLVASAGQLSAAERKAKAEDIMKKAKAARGK